MSTIRTHDLFKSNHLMFADLVDLTPNVELNTLVSSLIDLTAKDRAPKRFTVDLRARTLVDHESGHVNRSHAIVFAMELFSRKQLAQFPELLSKCFGLRNYDPVIHDKKIHNLLYRLRKIPGLPLSFRTKDGYVYCEGPWDQVTVVYPCQHQASLAPYPDWWDLAGSASREQDREPGMSAEEKAFELARLNGKWATRSEIQTLVGKPRSTTSRLIKSWVESGLIIKKGHTKKSLYRLQPQLLNQLQEEL